MYRHQFKIALVAMCLLGQAQATNNNHTATEQDTAGKIKQLEQKLQQLERSIITNETAVLRGSSPGNPTHFATKEDLFELLEETSTGVYKVNKSGAYYIQASMPLREYHKWSNSYIMLNRTKVAETRMYHWDYDGGQGIVVWSGYLTADDELQFGYTGSMSDAGTPWAVVQYTHVGI